MSDGQPNEVKSIGSLLARTAELAEQAGLTGAYEDGAKRCVQQYNASVARLETLAAVPPGFFLPLAENAGYGEVGIACAQLASYVGSGSGAASDGGATYHGPKYLVNHNHNSDLSKEERQELQEIKERLRQLTEKG